MARSRSRSAMSITLEIYEVEALIEWHRDNQWRYADKQEYQEAADSQSRASEIIEELTQHRARLAAERSPQVNPEVRHD